MVRVVWCSRDGAVPGTFRKAMCWTDQSPSNNTACSQEEGAELHKGFSWGAAQSPTASKLVQLLLADRLQRPHPPPRPAMRPSRQIGYVMQSPSAPAALCPFPEEREGRAVRGEWDQSQSTAGILSTSACEQTQNEAQ